MVKIITWSMGKGFNSFKVTFNDGTYIERTSIDPTQSTSEFSLVSTGETITSIEYSCLSGLVMKSIVVTTGDLTFTDLSANPIQVTDGGSANGWGFDMSLGYALDEMQHNGKRIKVAYADKATTATDYNTDSGTIKTALDAKLESTKCTYQISAPTAAISDGGVHIVYLSAEPATKYSGYIYLIAGS